jgi:hypothetical protein
MKNEVKVVFAAVIGTLYLLFGILEIGSWIFPGLAVAVMEVVPADVLGGFVLCVIGLVFLAGVQGLRSGKPGAVAFLFVGLLLSLAFGLITFLAVGAGWLETALFGDMSEWSVTEMAVPMFYLALVSIAGYAAWGREFFRGIARA